MAQLSAGTWNLDGHHSEISFSVRHAGISKVRGSFNNFEGTVEVPEDLTSAKANVSIDVDSIDTRDENRDGHLKGDDFFDVENYPKASFVSTGVKNLEGNEFVLVGDLTIHGVTQSVELEVEFGGQAVDAFGNTRAGFEAKTEISRKDFGLTWNAAIETGGVLVGDKIKIEIDISAVLPGEDN